MFRLNVTSEVQRVLEGLANNPKRLKKIRKALAQIETDPKYPGLNSHPFHTLFGPLGEPIWESYVENQAPSAWRVYWYYGPEQGEITIVALSSHS
jgi:hypothetical protein